VNLKHCLNPKVIAAVVAVAAGVYVFAPPGVFAAALPALILAICPLSMVAMVLLMRGRGDADEPTPADASAGALQARVDELERQLVAGSTSSAQRGHPSSKG
jgi:hypothetical protein